MNETKRLLIQETFYVGLGTKNIYFGQDDQPIPKHCKYCNENSPLRRFLSICHQVLSTWSMFFFFHTNTFSSLFLYVSLSLVYFFLYFLHLIRTYGTEGLIYLVKYRNQIE